MNIKDMFGATGEPVISFEFFPPKTDAGTETLYRTVEALGSCRPSFVSVTFGAGGSTRDRTLELVGRIKRDLDLEAMAHLTCVGSSKVQIREILERLQNSGIDNILALRGDPPAGETEFIQARDGFAHADGLIEFIRAEGFDFCLGGACYPEKHTESPDRDNDLAMTRQKVDAGLDFLITQLFFENSAYFDFLARAREAGIEVPIIPGLMPITNVEQVKRFTKMCGAAIPVELSRRLKIVEKDPSAVVATGVNWAIEQCRELLDRGVPGLHFYTLNKSSASLAVHAALGL